MRRAPWHYQKVLRLSLIGNMDGICHQERIRYTTPRPSIQKEGAVNMHEIYLAGGCFWGTEAYLQRLPGVVDTEVGYANSLIEDPSYEEVCSGRTEAAEAVRVRYDADIIPLALLLKAYFRTIDPLSRNRQGNDRGTQYRTGIYWTDPADEPMAYEPRFLPWRCNWVKRRASRPHRWATSRQQRPTIRTTWHETPSDIVM